jgi:23S rRNA pseudouridine955/2504/2580 synthase
MMDATKRWLEYTAAEDDDGRRFDRVVRKMFPRMGLSHIYKIIRRGETRLNGKRVTPSTRVRKGDSILVLESGEPLDEERSYSRVTAKGPSLSIPSMIVYENRHILALNKPSGLLVHGSGSLNTLVQLYLGPSRSPSLSFKPGPLHRLDRNTSGILLFAKTLKGSAVLSSLFKEGKIQKFYIALFEGRIDQRKIWEDSLKRDRETKKTLPCAGLQSSREGKLAVMEVFPAEVAKHATLALCLIHTGRTHQIRAQAASHGHPLIGDGKYGGSTLLPRYLLHAVSLRVEEATPLLGFHTLFAPLPSEFCTATVTFFGDDGLAGLRMLLEEHGISVKL